MLDALINDLRADRRLAARHRKGWLSAPFWTVAVVLYRVGTRVAHGVHPGAALPFQWLVQLLTGADIDMSAQIGPGFFMFHTVGVVIGGGVVAEGDLCLYGSVVLGIARTSDRGWGYPELGRDVEIYTKATVIGPAQVGSDVKIGAHALVLGDVADDTVVRTPDPAVV